MPDPITFARVCGVTLKLADGTVRRRLERVENNGATLVNTPINNRRGFRVALSATTTPTTRKRASALEGLILGLAHSWSYNTDAHSSRGKGPDDGVNLTIATSSPSPKTGAGYAAIDEAAYDLAAPDDVAELGDAWLWHGWKYSEADAAWQDVQVRSDGAVWVDGERDDTFDTSWLVIGFGVLGYSGPTLDDVALFLFEPDDEMVAELHAWHVDNVWPAFGSLVVDGDAVEGRTMVAVGEIDDGGVLQFADPDGGWENAGRAVRFTLSQVDTGLVESEEATALPFPQGLVYPNPEGMIFDGAGWYSAVAVTRVGGALSSVLGPFNVPAAVFDGTNMLRISGQDSRYDVSVAAPMTIAAWVNLLEDGGFSLAAIFGKGRVGVEAVPVLFMDGNLPAFGWWTSVSQATGIDVRAASGIAPSSWHFVCARYDGSLLAAGVDIVVDGVSVPVNVFSDAAPPAPSTNNTDPAIGSTNGTGVEFGFTGALDGVGMWSRRLTDAEVAELYRAGQRKRRPRFRPKGV